MSFKWKNLFPVSICSLLISRYRTFYLLVFPLSLTLALLQIFSYSSSTSSVFLLLSLPFLTTCLNFFVPFFAACNGTHRLWADGDDSQAVPAQAHHRWHQCLCSPHWLCPHQEGELKSLYSNNLTLFSPCPIFFATCFFPSTSVCVSEVRPALFSNVTLIQSFHWNVKHTYIL